MGPDENRSHGGSQGIVPATGKKTAKVAALAEKSVLCLMPQGCYPQREKTKHAMAGVFCAPQTGSTLLPMSDTPAPALASLKKLLPDLSEAEYASLDSWYAGYAALILRMYERITNDPAAYADFLALTSHLPRPTMTGKVDSPKQTEHT